MENKIKIFLVDDQHISNFIMKKVISTLAIDCEVIAFEKPKIALSALSEIKPHLIFLDLNMPLINGWQFLEQMQDHHDIKVVILTSSIDPIDEEKSKEFPQVISYETKPPSKEKIKAIISEESVNK